MEPRNPTPEAFRWFYPENDHEQPESFRNIRTVYRCLQAHDTLLSNLSIEHILPSSALPVHEGIFALHLFDPTWHKNIPDNRMPRKGLR